MLTDCPTLCLSRYNHSDQASGLAPGLYSPGARPVRAAHGASESLPARGLVLLARCSLVSQAWRAAASAAAALVADVDLGGVGHRALSASALSSPLLRSFASHWTSARICAHADFTRTPGHQSFLRHSCAALRSLHLEAERDLSRDCPEIALLQAAAAVLPGLQELSCDGFIPAALPPGLTSLYAAASRGKELEALVVRCSTLERLRKLEVELYSKDPIRLRRSALTGVQLSQLELLKLDVCSTQSTAGDDVDYSWLGSPRSFRVQLKVWNEHGPAPVGPYYWVHLLRHLQGCLLPEDRLGFSVEEEGLCAEAQEALSRLRVASFTLDVPPQRLELLPAAQEVTVNFEVRQELGSGPPACLSWGALVRCGRQVNACRIDVRAWGATTVGLSCRSPAAQT